MAAFPLLPPEAPYHPRVEEWDQIDLAARASLKKAQRALGAHLTIEDLRGQLWLGFRRACLEWRSGTGATWKTWLVFCLKLAVADQGRAEGPGGRSQIRRRKRIEEISLSFAARGLRASWRDLEDHGLGRVALFTALALCWSMDLTLADEDSDERDPNPIARQLVAEQPEPWEALVMRDDLEWVRRRVLTTPGLRRLEGLAHHNTVELAEQLGIGQSAVSHICLQARARARRLGYQPPGVPAPIGYTRARRPSDKVNPAILNAQKRREAHMGSGNSYDYRGYQVLLKKVRQRRKPSWTYTITKDGQRKRKAGGFASAEDAGKAAEEHIRMFMKIDDPRSAA